MKHKIDRADEGLLLRHVLAERAKACLPASSDRELRSTQNAAMNNPVTLGTVKTFRELARFDCL